MGSGCFKAVGFEKCTLTFADDADDAAVVDVDDAVVDAAVGAVVDAVVTAITAKSTIGVLIEAEQLK